LKICHTKFQDPVLISTTSYMTADVIMALLRGGIYKIQHQDDHK